MTYIVILLVALKSHLILSFLGCIVFGIVSQIIFPKQIRSALLKFSITFFVVIFLNIFLGHFLTNILIDNFGETGVGMVVSSSRTSDQYNNQTVYRYDVMIKPNSDDSNVVSTYFLSSDFNIVHKDSFNEYHYPSTGVKFNVKYIKNYPRAFVIIANDDSEYSKNLRVSKYSDEKSTIENQLKMDPENSDLKKKLDDINNKISDSSSSTSTSSTEISDGNKNTETLEKKFGGKGTDAGKLNDSRYITIDSDNNIWVADYDDGRIQEFNNSGDFIKIIQLPPDRNDNTLITGLAADMNGNLYVSFGGQIIKYKTADGSLSSTFKGDDYYGDLAVDTNNNLFLLTSSATGSDLFKLNSDGTVLARYDKIVEKINKNDPSMSASLALDSSNNIYILSNETNKIYTYNSNGEFIKYLDPQWSDSDNPSLNTPYKISITNNNLYINNFNGNYKFDINGNLLNFISKDSSRSMVTDSDGYTYILDTDGNILKYAPK